MNHFTRILLIGMALLAFAVTPTGAEATTQAQATSTIAPWTARFGRSRPVVAVIGENGGAVLSDYVIPYGVLAQSGNAEVLSVATQAAPLRLAPLQINPEYSIDSFDARYPDGADYVIVPAMRNNADPVLLGWLKAQAARGATMVSICNGSVVLAEAGLTRGHHVTGHWSSDKQRRRTFPDTHWVKNMRYVADGKIISSAGISAAIPVSLALVEAIAGTTRAQALAQELGLAHWSAQHNSDAFRLTVADGVAALASKLRPTEEVGLPVSEGMDEIRLSLTAEAYTATLRSRVFAVAATDTPVRTRSGLMVIPERVMGSGKPLVMLPPADGTPSGRLPDRLLADISARYGAAAARFVMLEWEYPQQGN